MRIPDITERFPEGYGGVDMTDRCMHDSNYYYPDDYDPYDLELEKQDYLIAQFIEEQGDDPETVSFDEWNDYVDKYYDMLNEEDD